VARGIGGVARAGGIGDEGQVDSFCGPSTSTETFINKIKKIVPGALRFAEV